MVRERNKAVSKEAAQKAKKREEAQTERKRACQQEYSEIMEKLSQCKTAADLKHFSVPQLKTITVWCVPHGKTTLKKDDLVNQYIDSGMPVVEVTDIP